MSDGKDSTSATAGQGRPLDAAARLHYLKAMGIQAWSLRQPPEAEFTNPISIQSSPENTEVGKPQVAAPVVSKTSIAQMDWQQLEHCVSQCQLCELHNSRTQTVFGVGNPDADLLIIGEAPGADEDRLGEPFVGRAGKLLDAMLAAIQLDRSQVYIANILKCRPPNNRDPHTSEIFCCDPYLQRQIELIKPKLILALGRISAHHLLVSQESLAKLRQAQHRYNGIPLVVSYHPAYLLRSPVEKRKSWQDLLKVKQLLKSL